MRGRPLRVAKRLTSSRLPLNLAAEQIMNTRHSIFLLLGLAVALGATGCTTPKLAQQKRVVYGERNDHELAYDFLQPRKTNGLGIVVIVSGGWRSNPDDFKLKMGKAFLRRGYSLFAVSHLSQPKATIPEIYDDVTRAVRHIREHAGEYGVDPGQLGVTGASAGAHLSLMVATRGKEATGKPDGLVRAVAIFFPVTDMLNPGKPSKKEKDGGPSKRFRKLFGIDPDDIDAWNRVGRELSPLHHVDVDTPPVLIIHGDADKVVSIKQSEWYIEAAEKHGATAKLIRKRGKGHGWVTILWDMRKFAKWFDEHLEPPAAN
jgi:acetyl esterase/lipase